MSENKTDISELITFPVRYSEYSIHLRDATGKQILTLPTDSTSSEMDATGEFIAQAINDYAERRKVEAENERLSQLFSKIEADLTNGDFCRYVEHSQDHCRCEDVHNYFKTISEQEAKA